MSDTRYLILLPLKFPDGQPVPAKYITEVQIELAPRFGGATLEPGRVSGMWVDEGQLVEDELVKLWTDVDDSSAVQLYMVTTPGTASTAFPPEDYLHHRPANPDSLNNSPEGSGD